MIILREIKHHVHAKRQTDFSFNSNGAKLVIIKASRDPRQLECLVNKKTKTQTRSLFNHCLYTKALYKLKILTSQTLRVLMKLF